VVLKSVLSKAIARYRAKVILQDAIGKRSSVNRMAAGSRVPRSSHGIFSPSPTFQTQHLKTGCRTRSPTDLQHLCCKALINKIKKLVREAIEAVRKFSFLCSVRHKYVLH